MLDKSLEYVEIIMKRKKGRPAEVYPLPDGFYFANFKTGDEIAWAEIEYSVNEFDALGDALLYFTQKYLPFHKALEQRCIFIEDTNGKKVATLTAWWEKPDIQRCPWISWVAVRPEYQGIGLGKALISRGMMLMRELEGDVDIYLKTQTWSYKAINIYRANGFRIQRKIGKKNREKLNYRKARKVLKGKLR